MSFSLLGRLGYSLLLLLLLATPGRAQSRRFMRLQSELARHPAPSLARERALWALAWEKEVLAARQDSLAAVATALATQLQDPAGQLAGQVAAARTQLAAGHRQAAQALLYPVLAEARRRGDAWLETLGLIQLGRTYWATARQTQALACWQQAWAAAQRQADPYWRVRTALLQANGNANYALALRWYFRGLQLAEQADCQACQAEALGSIGYTYAVLQDLTTAARYVHRALPLQQQLRDWDGERRNLIILADLQLQLRQYSAAIATYQRAAQRATTLDDSVTVRVGLADVYAAQGRYALAQAQAVPGLALAQRLGSRTLIATLETTLAASYLHQHQLARALAYGQRAYAHRQREATRTTTTTCRVLAQTYAARGHFAQAYAFQRRAEAYDDTLTSAQIRASATQSQYAYQLEKQQRQIAQLARDQALGQLHQQQQLVASGLAGLLLLGAGGGLFWALRRRQGRRVAALRAQLATDLHDEVGTLLTRVSVQAELLPSLPAAQQLPAVAGLLRNSRAAASTMRDVVWGIDARADSAGSLLDRMREYLHQTVGLAGWQTELEVSGWPDQTPLPAPIRQAVYRIFKEAVTNALRHAPSATRLHVALSRDQDQLLLTLTDDGHPAPTPPASSGMGLRNMQQRAAALGGQVLAGPQPGGGFHVRVVVPVPD